jgi:hypothetical protein
VIRIKRMVEHRTPGAIIEGSPVCKGLYERELEKSIDNPESQRNIKRVRKFLFGRK